MVVLYLKCKILYLQGFYICSDVRQSVLVHAEEAWTRTVDSKKKKNHFSGVIIV